VSAAVIDTVVGTRASGSVPPQATRMATTTIAKVRRVIDALAKEKACDQLGRGKYAPRGDYGKEGGVPFLLYATAHIIMPNDPLPQQVTA